MASSLKYTLHQYSTENDLQRVGVWDVDIADKSKYWIIYIHGGAWRDPRITLETFTPSIDQILLRETRSGQRQGQGQDQAHDQVQGQGQGHHRIAAFASLDYRLSPHPAFPQDRGATPPAQYRGARHPDHVDDARAALAFLQARYGFAANYVLVGHSAGGCMALQMLAGLLSHHPLSSSSSSLSSSSPLAPVSKARIPDDMMTPASPSPSPSTSTSAPTPAAATTTTALALPRAIISLEGIYDFAGISSRLGAPYAEFLAGAFGGEEGGGWAAAAPLGHARSVAERWRETGGRALVLAWSREDELVDEPEIDAMGAGLARHGVAGLAVRKDLRGAHDDIWRGGGEVARLVGMVLDDLVGG